MRCPVCNSSNFEWNFTKLGYNDHHQNVLLNYPSSIHRVSTVHLRRIHKVESDGIVMGYCVQRPTVQCETAIVVLADGLRQKFLISKK